MPNTPAPWNSTEIHFRSVTMNIKWILFVDGLLSGLYAEDTLSEGMGGYNGWRVPIAFSMREVAKKSSW